MKNPVPCIICGGEAKVGKKFSGKYVVTCGHRNRQGTPPYMDAYGDTEEEAVNNWNDMQNTQ
jgi:hypothetical protein